MLAAELALAGVDVAVVDPRRDQSLPGSRAGGLRARTLEVFDQRGIVDRFLDAGEAMQVTMFGGSSIDISDFPSRHPHGLALWQNRIEELLAGWVDELPVTWRREQAVSGLEQDAGGVTVQLASGGTLRTQYLVGCDGGRSAVRKAAGIAFTGWEPTMSSLIAEVKVDGEPEYGIKRDDRGQHGIGPLEGGEYVRVVAREPGVQQGEPTIDALSEAMIAVWGSDFGVHSPRWISRFTDAARQAERYRDGRVLLAGDAARVHSPVGGQGLNTGVQDAVNLGWKLAQVVHGTSPDSLLDSYHAERHPVGARVLQGTLAQTALMRSEPRTDALREIIAGLTEHDEVRRELGGLFSGLTIAYELDGGGEHPLVGRRMPDLKLTAGGEPTRVYELLHSARPLLLNLSGAQFAAELGPWVGRVQQVTASADRQWELPAIGAVAAPGAVLVRPDGYVSWCGALGDASLIAALETWFGTPS